MPGAGLAGLSGDISSDFSSMLSAAFREAPMIPMELKASDATHCWGRGHLNSGKSLLASAFDSGVTRKHLMQYAFRKGTRLEYRVHLINRVPTIPILFRATENIGFFCYLSGGRDEYRPTDLLLLFWDPERHRLVKYWPTSEGNY